MYTCINVKKAILIVAAVIVFTVVFVSLCVMREKSVLESQETGQGDLTPMLIHHSVLKGAN